MGSSSPRLGGEIKKISKTTNLTVNKFDGEEPTLPHRKCRNSVVVNSLGTNTYSPKVTVDLGGGYICLA